MTETLDAASPPHPPDSAVDAGPKRKSPKASRPSAGVLGSAIAVAGIVLSGVAIVLLIMVNPDCLNSEECGQLSQNYWELFGIKSSALVAGLLLIGAGLFLRHRAGRSSEFASRIAESSNSKGTATILRRKKIWIPLVAATCLALATGTWAAVTAGPSDEERRIAAEKRESAAAEAQREAEAEAEAELALQKEACETTISEFKTAVEAVDSKLNVGLVQSDFNNALGDARVAYDQLDTETILSDDYCISDVLGPLEDAFNIYVKSNTKWNKCITNFGCEVEGKVLDNLQVRWLRATVKVAQADQALENYGSSTTTAS